MSLALIHRNRAPHQMERKEISWLSVRREDRRDQMAHIPSDIFAELIFGIDAGTDKGGELIELALKMIGVGFCLNGLKQPAQLIDHRSRLGTDSINAVS
jgi:hypothetical protein